MASWTAPRCPSRGGISLFEGGDQAGAMEMWRRALESFAKGDTVPEAAFRLAFGRDPTSEEQRLLVVSLREHGLETVCRALLNLNEFAFVD